MKRPQGLVLTVFHKVLGNKLQEYVAASSMQALIHLLPTVLDKIFGDFFTF